MKATKTKTGGQGGISQRFDHTYSTYIRCVAKVAGVGSIVVIIISCLVYNWYSRRLGFIASKRSPWCHLFHSYSFSIKLSKKIIFLSAKTTWKMNNNKTTTCKATLHLTSSLLLRWRHIQTFFWPNLNWTFCKGSKTRFRFRTVKVHESKKHNNEMDEYLSDRVLSRVKGLYGHCLCHDWLLWKKEEGVFGRTGFLKLEGCVEGNRAHSLSPPLSLSSTHCHRIFPISRLGTDKSSPAPSRRAPVKRLHQSMGE